MCRGSCRVLWTKWLSSPLDGALGDDIPLTRRLADAN